MEWWLILTFFLGGLMALLLLGFPIAFAFLLVDFIGVYVYMGTGGLSHMTLNIYNSLSTFNIAPVPLFIFMGELMFHSKIAYNTIDVLDRWLGRVPGRLGLLAATSGTIFAATSGSTMANTAMLGTVLLPEMKQRGYSNTASVGPIIGVGGLAMLIPPSALAVVLASIGQISVGDLLIAGVVPGILLGIIFAAYIIIGAMVKPQSAPAYAIEPTPVITKLLLTLKYVFPMAFIIFMVIGLILMGVATPTEAAASGAIATLIVTIVYRRFTWKMMKDTLIGSLEISIMVFMIIGGSKAFSSILAYSGVTNGLTGLVEGLTVHPIMILIVMQLVILFMGCFMDAISIMMICLPVFMPISNLLGFDPVWFGVLMLINLEMGQITPPFGMLLFVMKGVTPPDVTIEEITLASVPYIIFDIIVMAIIIVWPDITLWLPGLLGQ